MEVHRYLLISQSIPIYQLINWKIASIHVIIVWLAVMITAENHYSSLGAYYTSRKPPK
jgi:hypothetical protein